MLDRAYAVIMAGGRGERFWPLSTTRRPKQFLKLVGGKTLLMGAVERIERLIPPERILVITTSELADAAAEAAPSVPRKNIIGEPFGRDTAAAVALGSALVQARDPAGVFCVLTADHVIADPDVYINTMREALRLAAEHDVVITIGMTPVFPSTGFGYIEAGDLLRTAGGVEFFKVRRFVEKPDAKTAEEYVRSGRFYWNSGMFAWSLRALQDALAQHCPPLHAMAQRLAACAASPDFHKALREEYGKLQRISVDYALMEKASNIVMAKGTFAWDDVGSWTALENHFPKDSRGNVVIGEGAFREADGNVVVSEGRLTALIGVRDLVVVQAEGATLICPKDRAQEVKKLVEQLKQTRHQNLL